MDTHLPSLQSWPVWDASFRIEEDEYVAIYDPDLDDAWLSAPKDVCMNIKNAL